MAKLDAALPGARDLYLRLSMALALVRHLVAQRIVIDAREQLLFVGVFAIFGHGNVVWLGKALREVNDVLPTWRGQNEQLLSLPPRLTPKHTNGGVYASPPPRSDQGPPTW